MKTSKPERASSDPNAREPSTIYLVQEDNADRTLSAAREELPEAPPFEGVIEAELDITIGTDFTDDPHLTWRHYGPPDRPTPRQRR
jgi:hypothetical protein